MPGAQIYMMALEVFSVCLILFGLASRRQDYRTLAPLGVLLSLGPTTYLIGGRGLSRVWIPAAIVVCAAALLWFVRSVRALRPKHRS